MLTSVYNNWTKGWMNVPKWIWVNPVQWNIIEHCSIWIQLKWFQLKFLSSKSQFKSHPNPHTHTHTARSCWFETKFAHQVGKYLIKNTYCEINSKRSKHFKEKKALFVYNSIILCETQSSRVDQARPLYLESTTKLNVTKTT